MYIHNLERNQPYLLHEHTTVHYVSSLLSLTSLMDRMTAVSVDVKSSVPSFLLLLTSMIDRMWSVWPFLLSLTSRIDRMTAVCMVLALLTDVSNRPYDCGLC